MLRPISKSLFNEYRQCAHRFWIKVNGLLNEASQPSGREIYFKEQQELIAEYTLQKLKEKEDCRFEQHKKVTNGNFVATADIYEYHKELGKTAIYEVRNAKSVKGHHIWELAYLAYLFQEAGEPLSKIYLVHVNGDYVYKEDTLDVDQLVNIVDVSRRVWRKMKQMKQKVEGVLNFAQGPHPAKDLASHSCRSKDCEYIRRYHPDLPEHTVYDLKRLTKVNRKKLLEEGVVDMLEIPSEYIEHEMQHTQLKLAQENHPILYKTALQDWLDQLVYPIYFIDYEALTSSVPLYKHTQPFQHVVFQYSLHVIPNPGAEVEHFEFLANDRKLPIPELLKQLNQEMNQQGSVLVWHDSFEKARNREMAALCPEYSELLLGMNDRMVDMEKVFNLDEGLYLHPDFNGKSSIKKILPVLVPNAERYKDLDISDGMGAAIIWFNYLTGDIPPEEEPKMRSDLLAYCKLDTLGMVDILKFLFQLF